MTDPNLRIDLSHASIHGLQVLSTGAWKITLQTQELSPDEVLKLSSALQTGTQITTRVKPELEMKTPSERLRAVIYKDWEMNGEKKGGFEIYYNRLMESIIDHFKEKLD